MKWNNVEIGELIGCTRQTVYSYVQKFQSEGKFKKKYPGRGYGIPDMKRLSELLGFDYNDAVKLKSEKTN